MTEIRYTQLSLINMGVRKYIADKIGEEYLVPLVGGHWKDFDDIYFDTLPEQYVLKCTNDSGGIVICRDKRKLDIKAACVKISRSLNRNYYYFGREWPYKDTAADDRREVHERRKQ